MNLRYRTPLLLTLSSVIIAPALAIACGVNISVDPNLSSWQYDPEPSMTGYVHFTEGREKLLFVHENHSQTGGSLSFIPVPGAPSKITVDIVTKTPIFRGVEVTAEAQEKVKGIRQSLNTTQLYPAIYYFVTRPLGLSSATAPIAGAPKGFGLVPETASPQTDVQVHDRIEKEGMIAELISAKTIQGLQEYFTQKNLQIEAKSISVLTHYIGQDYSFVASWEEPKDSVLRSPIAEPATDVEPTDNAKKLQPGDQAAGSTEKRATRRKPSTVRAIYISFPTDRIYYPLRPSSVYGSKTIKETLLVSGHVTPEIYADLKDYADVSYYQEIPSSIEPALYTDQLEGFFGKTAPSPFRYTKIDLDVPSKFLTDDLWFKDSAPASIVLGRNVMSVGGTIGLFILLFIGLSLLAGVIAGYLTFKDQRSNRDLRHYAWLGLGNILSLIGLVFVTAFAKTKQVPLEPPDENNLHGLSTRPNPRMDARKLLFVPIFSVIFVVLGSVITLIIEKLIG